MNFFSRRFCFALFGFLLPWQTRFILHAPVVGGAIQDFAVVSIYLAQIILLLVLIGMIWIERAALVVWWSTVWTQKINQRWRVLFGVGAAFFLIIFQVVISANVWLTISGWISILLLSGLVITLLKIPELRLPFFGGFLIAVSGQALLAFVQVFFGVTFASTLLGVARHRASELGVAVVEYGGTRYLRAYGGQSHPNIFGGLLVLALAIYGWSAGVMKNLGEKNNVIKIAALLVAALFFTYSRSAWGAAALLAGATWLGRAHLQVGQRRFLVWSIGIFVGLVVIFWSVVWSRVLLTTRLETQSITQRVSGLTDWQNVMRAHWLTGTGLWNYSVVLPPTVGFEMTPVHSAPLLFVAEFGVVGVLLLVIIIWSVLSIRTVRQLLHRQWHWLLFLIIIFPIAAFDHYLYSLWPGLVSLFLGWLVAHLFFAD